MKELGQRMRCQFPDGTVVGNVLGQRARTRRNRRSGGQPFDAVAMKTADPRPQITRPARDAHMPEFTVVAAEYRLAPNDEADADPGPDCDVGKVRKIARAPPTALGEGGAIDVGVESDGHAVNTAEATDDVDSIPSRLHRRNDVTKAARAGAQI